MGIMRLVLCCLALLCTTAWCANKTFGAGACTSSNQATCCHPDGTKFCAAIKASDIAAVSNGVCVWTNLAGQTEDISKQWNSPWINNFACGKDDCNVANATSISSNVGTVYYGMVSNLSDISAGAKKAAEYYAAFNVALSRYNCEEQYSHWNCDDCRKAYARWACAMTMPACSHTPCGTTKPCVRICNEVVQKCPVTLGFTCPDDNRDYSSSSCNLMGLASGTTSTAVPTFATAMLVMAAAAFSR